MLGLGCTINQDVMKVHYNISGLETNRFIPAVNSLLWKYAWNLLNEIGVHPQIVEFVVAIDFSHDAEGEHERNEVYDPMQDREQDIGALIDFAEVMECA
ncbi:hypothetical protein Q9L58_008704 [Maublancomyces gigas]|uniref:Uncharacterized protein n=1 Tax=Discina gigas TaxID=1032678 RepID=A0ABR3G975_9PEZI